MPRRILEVDELIRNLHEYFTAEKNNFGPITPVTEVHKRVTEALKISDTKLYRVLKGARASNEDNPELNQENPEENNSDSVSGQTNKYKRRHRVKTDDVSMGQKSAIRDVIYNMYAQKKTHNVRYTSS